MRGIRASMRMRTILLFSLLSVSCGLTILSLVVVRSSLTGQIRENLLADLDHSVATFQNLQAQQRGMQAREAALLAEQPYLKSLMTSNDPATIQNAGAEFWRVSGSDLFALIDGRGSLVALYVKGAPAERLEMSKQLQKLLDTENDQQYLFAANRLFEISERPLYLGSENAGLRLGSVVIGHEIDQQVVQAVRQASAADVVFYADRTIASSSLDGQHNKAFLQHPEWLTGPSMKGSDIWLGKEHYLATQLSLSNSGSLNLQLVVLKSYDAASRGLRSLNKLLLGLGALVLGIGSLLALSISKMITRPLETLVAGAQALGSGNFDYELGKEGMKELQELSDAFGSMRLQLKQSQRELVESARLATIGRMANSISHDLRHYLSAVYANAEFLGYSQVSEEERAELLGEVRSAVQGMTEMLDSLLIFGRTGRSFHPAYESLPQLIERTLALVKTHPDTASTHFRLELMPRLEAYIDARNVERAVYNLLLNASQASRKSAYVPEVALTLSETVDQVQIRVIDNGPGVSETMRKTLFEPFSSEGKESGTGLGLTVAQRVAQDHGGQVVLERSRPGETVFALCMAKSVLTMQPPAAQPSLVVDK